MALKYPDILQSNNPAAYGIVPATEVSGHKQVANLTALYALADPILSLSGNNTNNDAIGQLWYVASEGKHYQLVDWANRKNANGWKEFKSGGGSKNMPFNGFISVAIEEEIKQSTDSPAEVYYYTVDGIFIAQDNDGNSYYEWEETAEFPSSEEYGDYEGGVSAVSDRNYINLSNGQLYIYDPNHNTSALSRAVRPRVAYGTCSTAANVAEKIVTLHDDFKDWRLEVGAEFVVTGSYDNTAESPSLNVNNTGAKGIKYVGEIVGSNTSLSKVMATIPVRYMYDGEYYVWIGWSRDSNATYSPHTLGFGYGICETAATTAAKTATLASYTIVKNGIVSIKFTNSVPASATLNINSRGAKPIFYRGSAIVAGVINAGDVVTFIYNGTNYIYLGTDNALSRAGGTMTGDLLMTSNGIISVMTDEDSSHAAVMGVDENDISYMQADAIKKIGGTSDQVLLADGSVAGTITTAWLEANLT